MSHIYTLPEEFIHDSSVPIHWKLYALINGFWINSLPVYASSRHFAVKLKCSDRHIRGSLERLEKMGLIDRQIDGHKRLILPGTRKSQFLVPGTPSSADPELPVPPNAFSISTNKTSEADASQELRYEVEENKPRTRKDTTYLKVFELWGKYPLNWKQNRTEIAAGQNILAEHGLEKAANALRFAREHADVPDCPQILKPSDLDRKWVNLLAFKGRV